MGDSRRVFALLALAALLGPGMIFAAAEDLAGDEPPVPPVPRKLPIRIADGRSNTSGILQVWDEASQAWGSVCISPSAFRYVASPDRNDEFWTELAVLACRQMGLPSANAAIVNPESRRYRWRTQKIADELPAKAVIRFFYSGCAEAATAESMFDCVGQLAVLDRAAGDCSEAAQLVKAGSTFTPVAITCRNPRKASPPPPGRPPVPPSPPPPPPLRYSNYTMRLVDFETGLTVNAKGKQVSDGRLEVLLPNADGQPVWGSVCNDDYSGIPTAMGQYACRQLGLPWQYSWVTTYYSSSQNATAAAIPVHWVAAKACAMDEETGALGCQLTLSEAQAMAAIEKYKDDWSPMRGYFRSPEELQSVIRNCASRGHQADLRVTCWGKPPAPPPPPVPKVAVRNDVVLEYDTHFDSMYTVRFGARAHGAPATDPLFWGTSCLPVDDYDALARNDRIVGHTLCNQITNGTRPYGVWVYAYGLPFVETDFLVVQESPVTLSSIECVLYGGPKEEAELVAIGSSSTWSGFKFVGVPKNISFCKATVVDPIPNSVNNTCYPYYSSMVQNTLACHRQDYINIASGDLLNVRLTGGDGTWGRVEVLDRRYLKHPVLKGWRRICASALNAQHAQAICRDLGLGWQGAAVLPPSAVVVAEPEGDRRMDQLGCVDYPYLDPRGLLGEMPRMSFLRDCYDTSRTQLAMCESGQSAVIACGNAAPTPSPSPAPSYGNSPPPAYYGPYGGRPPVYGPYGTY
ncbi:hypothetical protein HYH03_015023 [Edaphochlamys debaryana]|uniref:SRCR domain-containing protein n=1 Tax=Edaphochlamys debaryana TaxID=47281 RepID=A0A835XUW9_9CHLO|nr:hypothetical protein HYH03_015023 [Edaphochlamys debaryana]|eukprot:KAG2486319.1 hypothetical protein HYH03_015023 [Edaphochlamys debaryana]